MRLRVLPQIDGKNEEFVATDSQKKCREEKKNLLPQIHRKVQRRNRKKLLPQIHRKNAEKKKEFVATDSQKNAEKTMAIDAQKIHTKKNTQYV